MCGTRQARDGIKHQIRKGKLKRPKGQAEWVRVRTRSAYESTPPALVAPAVGGGAGPASLWLRLFDAPLATCLQSEEQSGKGRREAMCVRLNSTLYWLVGLLPRRSGQEGKGRALGEGSRTLLVARHSLGDVLEAHWSLREGAGKSSSSQPFLFATLSPFSLGLLLAECDSARGCGNHRLAA